VGGQRQVPDEAPRKEFRYPFYIRQGGPQCRSGWMSRKRNFFLHCCWSTYQSKLRYPGPCIHIYNTHFWTGKISLQRYTTLFNALWRKCTGRSWYCQRSVFTNNSGLPCRYVRRSQQYAVRGIICNPDANDCCT
jgi:hypothetical protein